MMELTLTAFQKTENSTISELRIDGTFECYVLEDTVREVAGRPVSEWKIPHMTAIPAGRYRIDNTMSPRFGRVLPLLLDVPGYAGIRIHPGNVAADTDGCLLPGVGFDVDRVTGSKVAFAKLFEKIDGAISSGEPVWIEVNRGTA